MKYEKILATFVAYTALLAAIVLLLWTLPDRRKAEPVEGWTVGSSGGVSFQYPQALGAQYINAFDWPPQFQKIDEEFSCTEAGESEERAGRTDLKEINGREYCVTEIVQGAAGSIYTQYAYAFEKDGETVILNFSTQMPQCGNYPEMEKVQCENERLAFDLDKIVDKIARTAAF
jgi:hypothetical protein